MSSEYIVDYDLVGLSTYPEGLNSLESEAVRHQDVKNAIKSVRIQHLKPEKNITGFLWQRFCTCLYPKSGGRVKQFLLSRMDSSRRLLHC
jgi:hypothetical protein